MDSIQTQEQNTQDTAEFDSSAALLSGQAETPPQRDGSPFDAIYQEGALDALPEDLKGLKSWIQAQKDGMGLEKGLRHLQKLASSKGIERPAEDAPEEQRQAFDAKLRDLMGVPKTPDAYEFQLPEGLALPDEVKGNIAKFAHERGIPPKVVEDFLPFQVELEKAAQQRSLELHIESEQKRGDSYFGGEGMFDAEAPRIAKWAQERGYLVKDDPAFRCATTYKILADLKAAVSEDKHVKGASTAAQFAPNQAKEKMQVLLQSGALSSSDTATRQKAEQEYLTLAKMAFNKTM
jgi:hypothetical protein